MCVTLLQLWWDLQSFALLPPLVLAKAIGLSTAGQTFLLLWLCPILTAFINKCCHLLCVKAF